MGIFNEMHPSKDSYYYKSRFLYHEHNAQTFKIYNEEHTIVNALKFMCNTNPRVEFCAYCIPHPSEALVNFRIQTSGHITAVEAIDVSLHQLKILFQNIKQEFQRKTGDFKIKLTNQMIKYGDYAELPWEKNLNCYFK